MSAPLLDGHYPVNSPIITIDGLFLDWVTLTGLAEFQRRGDPMLQGASR